MRAYFLIVCAGLFFALTGPSLAQQNNGRDVESARQQKSLISALEGRTSYWWDDAQAIALVKVSGGRAAAPTRLRQQLRSPEPSKRAAAASALGFLMLAASNCAVQYAPGRYSPPDDDVAFLQDCLPCLPPLAASLSDKDPAVRAAAARSLQRWADWMRQLGGVLPRLSPLLANTLWDAALPSMSRALQTSDLPVRRALAEAFSSLTAFSWSARAAHEVPIAILPHLLALRAALHDADSSVRASTHEAFENLTRLQATPVAAFFLVDLQSDDLARRRAASIELAQTADVLWRKLTNASFQAKTPDAQEKTRLRREISEALTKILETKDAETRTAAEQAALKIIEWTASAQWHGQLREDGRWANPLLDKAIEVTAQNGDPLAPRFKVFHLTLFSISSPP